VDWDAIAARLKLATGDEAKKLLNGFVERRNEIAHSGDVPAGTTRATSINRPYVDKCLRTTRATAEQISSDLDSFT
jgi:hypothetical protein